LGEQQEQQQEYLDNDGMREAQNGCHASTAYEYDKPLL